MADRGQLIVISSPSGGGKTTVCDAVIRQVPGTARAVTATTRMPRAGEVDGKDYFFLSSEAFVQKKDKQGFLEWAQVHGNFYGTPRDEVNRLRDEGKTVILVIDVQGAASIKKMEPDAKTIFIVPPGKNLEEQKKILTQRLVERNTDTRDVVRARVMEAEKELERMGEFDFSVVNNAVDETVARICEYLET